MPRVNLGKPEAQLNIERELRKKYGNRIRQRDMIDYFNMSRPWVAEWLKNVPAVCADTRTKLYSPERIAKEIYTRAEPGAFD